MMNVSNTGSVSMASERSSRRFWILLVLGFFAIDFVIAIVAITMAAGDPSFRSIPGFSERSVHWDARQKKQRNLEELGWTIEVDKSLSRKDSLAIRVLDRDRREVSGVKLKVTLFHYTRVAEQQKMSLEPSEDVYRAAVQLAKPGLWHVDIEGSSSDGKEIWTQQTLDWEPGTSHNNILDSGSEKGSH